MNGKVIIGTLGVAMLGVALYFAHGLVVALLAVAGLACVLVSRELV